MHQSLPGAAHPQGGISLFLPGPPTAKLCSRLCARLGWGKGGKEPSRGTRAVPTAGEDEDHPLTPTRAPPSQRLPAPELHSGEEPVPGRQGAEDGDLIVQEGNPSTERTSSASTEKKSSPSTEKKSNPGTERKDSPSTEKKSNPGTERNDSPSTEKKSNPGTERKDSPSTEKKSNPGTERKDSPSTEKKGKPNTERKGSRSTEASS
ncbi:hypothetical protein NDU88_000826 [Pleurodeles waltl]|uniref:Uncharacterized protein n=1 Tax=Pleurodeles waltl TaxID=8319 RepID=A0AAV7LW04_PLEWA|nr:hypothetical protein NDU88_000826 [Pleurodeles waltl]